MSRSLPVLRIAALFPFALAAAGCGADLPEPERPSNTRQARMDERHNEAASRASEQASDAAPRVTIEGGAGAAARSAKAKTGGERAGRPFPRGDAQTALVAAARGLRVCRTHGAAEELHAKLRFDPSGNVTDVELARGSTFPRSDDPLASCVRNKLEEVAVLPFDGDAVTVRMRVRL